MAARVGATLRLASFAVWHQPAYTTRLGSDGEDTVLADWLSDMREATQEVLTKVRELPDVPRDLEAVVGIGPTRAAALEDVDWDDGDVLVLGSSALGPVARVFLGSRATKIVRHSPCPWSLSRARLVRASESTRAPGLTAGLAAEPRRVQAASTRWTRAPSRWCAASWPMPRTAHDGSCPSGGTVPAAELATRREAVIRAQGRLPDEVLRHQRGPALPRPPHGWVGAFTRPASTSSLPSQPRGALVTVLDGDRDTLASFALSPRAPRSTWASPRSANPAGPRRLQHR